MACRRSCSPISAMVMISPRRITRRWFRPMPASIIRSAPPRRQPDRRRCACPCRRESLRQCHAYSQRTRKLLRVCTKLLNGDGWKYPKKVKLKRFSHVRRSSCVLAGILRSRSASWVSECVEKPGKRPVPVRPYINDPSYKLLFRHGNRRFAYPLATLTDDDAACVFVFLGLRQSDAVRTGRGFLNDSIGGGAGRAGIAA